MTTETLSRYRNRWKTDAVTKNELADKYFMTVPEGTDPSHARPARFRRSLTLLCIYDTLYIIFKAVITIDRSFFSRDFGLIQCLGLVFIVYGAAESWAWNEKRTEKSTQYLHKAWYNALLDSYGPPHLVRRGLDQVHELGRGLMFDLVCFLWVTIGRVQADIYYAPGYSDGLRFWHCHGHSSCKWSPSSRYGYLPGVPGGRLSSSLESHEASQ